MHRIGLIFPPLFWTSVVWFAIALGMNAVKWSMGGRSVGWHVFGLIAYGLFWISLIALAGLTIIAFATYGTIPLHSGR
jgi:hypothetical protein